MQLVCGVLMAYRIGHTSVVGVVQHSPGKFRVIVSNPEFPHLSPYDGVLTEQELRTLLTDKYTKSPVEIETLINEAKRKSEKEG